MANNQVVAISAGSGYGTRTAYYEMVAHHRLVMLYEGDDENLVGNYLAAEFEGLTLAEAQAKAKAINSESVGHDFDGCHACTFSITVYELADDEVPEWISYSEPVVAAIVRRALELASQLIHARPTLTADKVLCEREVDPEVQAMLDNLLGKETLAKLEAGIGGGK